MDIDKLRGELEIDEGICHHVYLDHLGYPTFGIGHLIVEGDPEYPGTEGEPVSPDRVIEAFEADLEGVLLDCKKLYVDFDELPEEAQHIIANMMFNMGLTRLSKFKGMKRGVDNRDWNQAVDEMVDSRWYEQVTNRANRLVDRMRNIEHS